MVAYLAKDWWALALRGGLAVLFGVLALIWPEPTLATLVLLFGSYTLVDGVLGVVKGVTHLSRPGGWSWLLGGVVSILVGLITFNWPAITGLALLYVIGAWAIMTGVFEVMAAIALRKELPHEWLLVIGGLASLLFGLLCFVWPGASALALIWLIGAYAILFGAVLISFAFRLHALGDRVAAARSAA